MLPKLVWPSSKANLQDTRNKFFRLSNPYIMTMHRPQNSKQHEWKVFPTDHRRLLLFSCLLALHLLFFSEPWQKQQTKEPKPPHVDTTLPFQFVCAGWCGGQFRNAKCFSCYGQKLLVRPCCCCDCVLQKNEPNQIIKETAG